ncbi:MAG: acyl-CoA thioesterase II [Cytophagaceae bacterium]|nr:acyl-CoA thioesterase II [Cytophagaceae bacterium]
MNNIHELVNLISLERLSDSVFLGQNYQAPWKRVFGGQVLAQSLSAATQTVDPERKAHSMHAYFLLAGDINIPIIFEVEKIRDGGSFSTRRVVAKQNGIAIFFMSVSFQKLIDGYGHQIDMPKVPGPEGLLSDEDLLKKYKLFVPDNIFELVKTRPFEFRMVEKVNFLSLSKKLPFRHFWFKSHEKLDVQPNIHQQLLSYVSDYNLLTTATLPHTNSPIAKDFFIASLDHAMWFHHEFRIDDWLLYAIDSPSASFGRGFARGNIFTKDGVLVASVVQEGVIKPLKE